VGNFLFLILRLVFVFVFDITFVFVICSQHSALTCRDVYGRNGHWLAVMRICTLLDAER
jgi:hypothetical protein